MVYRVFGFGLRKAQRLWNLGVCRASRLLITVTTIAFIAILTVIVIAIEISLTNYHDYCSNSASISTGTIIAVLIISLSLLTRLLLVLLF